LSPLSAGADPLDAAVAIGVIGGPITIVIAGGATVFGIAVGNARHERKPGNSLGPSFSYRLGAARAEVPLRTPVQARGRRIEAVRRSSVLGAVVVTLINWGVPLSPLVTFWINLWVGLTVASLALWAALYHPKEGAAQSA